MSAVVLSQAAAEDVERLAQFLRDASPEGAEATIGLVMDALAILVDHPRIGRPAEGDFHELLISRGHSGYIALYEYDAARDQVIVHRIRHQREAGFEEA